MAGMDMRAALLLLATLCLALGLLTSVNLPGVAETLTGSFINLSREASQSPADGINNRVD
jgi:hypothetical protein